MTMMVMIISNNSNINNNDANNKDNDNNDNEKSTNIVLKPMIKIIMNLR